MISCDDLQCTMHAKMHCTNNHWRNDIIYPKMTSFHQGLGCRAQLSGFRASERIKKASKALTTRSGLSYILPEPFSLVSSPRTLNPSLHQEQTAGGRAPATGTSGKKWQMAAKGVMGSGGVEKAFRARALSEKVLTGGGLEHQVSFKSPAPIKGREIEHTGQTGQTDGQAGSQADRQADRQTPDTEAGAHAHTNAIEGNLNPGPNPSPIPIPIPILSPPKP